MFNFTVHEDLKEKYQERAFSNIIKKTIKQFDIAINYKKHSVATKNERIRKFKSVYSLENNDSYLYIVEENGLLVSYLMTFDSLKKLKMHILFRGETHIVYSVEKLDIYVELDLYGTITFLSNKTQCELEGVVFNGRKNILDKYFVDLFMDLKKTNDYNEAVKILELEKNVDVDAYNIGRFSIKKCPYAPIKMQMQMQMVHVW